MSGMSIRLPDWFDASCGVDGDEGGEGGVSLYESVCLTYAAMRHAVEERFGEGRFQYAFYVPDLIPFYRKHLDACEALFRAVAQNPDSLTYYRQVRQLFNRGYCTDVHCCPIKEFPPLPSVHEFCG